MPELTQIVGTITGLGALILAILSFKTSRNTAKRTADGEMTQAHLADVQLFRKELREEIHALRDELKETNAKLDEAESRILKLQAEIADLTLQKRILAQDKEREKKAFEGKINRLQMRMSALEKVLTDHNIPFNHI